MQGGLWTEELTNVAYTFLNEPTDYADKVDFTKLSVLEDRKMLHGWGYYGFFKPSVGEVIRQIPKDSLEKVVAFEIIDGAIAMNSTSNYRVPHYWCKNTSRHVWRRV